MQPASYLHSHDSVAAHSRCRWPYCDGKQWPVRNSETAISFADTIIKVMLKKWSHMWSRFETPSHGFPSQSDHRLYLKFPLHDFEYLQCNRIEPTLMRSSRVVQYTKCHGCLCAILIHRHQVFPNGQVWPDSKGSKLASMLSLHTQAELPGWGVGCPVSSFLM